MKKIVIIIFILIPSMEAFSQNTFPATGNVGIGISSPGFPLHVVDESGHFTFGRNVMNNRLVLNATTGYENQIYLRWGNGRIFTNHGWDLTLGNSSTANNLVISGSNGFVGIGVTDPEAKFHIIDGEGFARSSISGQGGWFVKRNITTSSESLFSVQNGNDGFAIYARGDGNVGIGTNDPQSKLAVNGEIRATKVKVLTDISVPDYVFDEGYELPTLKEIKQYISQNKHLPEIPSAAEIEKNGINLGNMNMRLLKKIEELTLYQIQLLERLEKAEKEISDLQNKK